MNDLQDEGRKTAASTYLIDSSIPDYSKSNLEMQVHQQQGTLSRRNNHMPSIMGMDSPPQRSSAGGTLSGGSTTTTASTTTTTTTITTTTTATTTTRTDNLPRCQNLSRFMYRS